MGLILPFEFVWYPAGLAGILEVFKTDRYSRMRRGGIDVQNATRGIQKKITRIVQKSRYFIRRFIAEHLINCFKERGELVALDIFIFTAKPMEP